MTKDETHNVEGWQLDSKEVRQIATRMGIPTSTPLPEVIVVGEGQEEYYQGRPMIHKTASKDSPTGYHITIPEGFLERVDEDDYVLGRRAREDLKHELAHYEDYLGGGFVGLEDKPYEHALRELRMELRSKPRNMSLTLARQAGGLVHDYDLSAEDALKTVADAAKELGISSRVISRMYKLCEE